MQCEMLHHLLHRIDITAYADETNDVPGDPARQCHQVLLGPIGQWNIPGKSYQVSVGPCREEPGHGSNLDIRFRKRWVERPLGCERTQNKAAAQARARANTAIGLLH